VDVGNCRFDHTSIALLLQGNFNVEVLRASGAEEAIDVLRAGPIDLVLVNRIFAADGSEGIEVIRRLKADPELGRLPVMLVSNYPLCPAISNGSARQGSALRIMPPKSAAYPRCPAVDTRAPTIGWARG